MAKSTGENALYERLKKNEGKASKLYSVLTLLSNKYGRSVLDAFQNMTTINAETFPELASKYGLVRNRLYDVIAELEVAGFVDVISIRPVEAVVRQSVYDDFINKLSEWPMNEAQITANSSGPTEKIRSVMSILEFYLGIDMQIIMSLAEQQCYVGGLQAIISKSINVKKERRGVRKQLAQPTMHRHLTKLMNSGIVKRNEDTYPPEYMLHADLVNLHLNSIELFDCFSFNNKVALRTIKRPESTFVYDEDGNFIRRGRTPMPLSKPKPDQGERKKKVKKHKGEQ